MNKMLVIDKVIVAMHIATLLALVIYFVCSLSGVDVRDAIQAINYQPQLSASLFYECDLLSITRNEPVSQSIN